MSGSHTSATWFLDTGLGPSLACIHKQSRPVERTRPATAAMRHLVVEESLTEDDDDVDTTQHIIMYSLFLKGDVTEVVQRRFTNENNGLYAHGI